MIQDPANAVHPSQSAQQREAPAPAIVLEARGLKKTYGSGDRLISVLQNANLSLREGEMVAIVAPSGAGKRTLLHLLAALDTPTSGKGYFASKAIEEKQEAEVADVRNRGLGVF